MRGLLLVGLVVLASGCPKVGRLIYRFDLTTGRGTLIAEDIGTDDPMNARSDFAKIVNDFVLGQGLAEEHPAWRLGERKLYERDGRLDGVVEFGFSRPVDAGLYQYDKKSAWLWCSSGDPVVASSGEIVLPYPTCAAFHRKTKTFEITVAGDGDGISLLPLFQSWDGGPVEPGPTIEEMEAMRRALMGGPPGLAGLLPDVPVPPEWAALGLPTAAGKVVYATDKALQVSHEGRAAEVLPLYESALAAAGFTLAEQGSEASKWARGEETLSLSATQAGATVIVALAR